MGATDPHPPIGYPSVINDVTPYVHRARDAAKNGTIYFPESEDSYVGAFEFLAATEEINIIGDGQGTILKSNGSVDGSGNHNPVLRLGYRGPNVWRNPTGAGLPVGATRA